MDPTRLLEDELDEFERALLRSARFDEPDTRAIARAAVALGVGTTTLTVAAGTAAASAVPGASTAVGTFSKLGALGIVKWLSIGVVSGLVTTSGVEIARTAVVGSPDEPAAAVANARPTAMRARPQTKSDLSPIPVPPAPADTAAVEEAPPTLAFAELPLKASAPPARPAPPQVARRGSDALPPAAPPAERGTASPASTAAFTPPAASGAAEAPKVVSIADETAMLDRARRALASGSAATALTELDSYDQRAHARALSTEASVLRIEALLQAGQRTSAVALAQRLLTAQPNGPHANRLRSIVASSPYLLRGSSLETQPR